jgi:hypothetical protein
MAVNVPALFWKVTLSPQAASGRQSITMAIRAHGFSQVICPSPSEADEELGSSVTKFSKKAAPA